MLPFISIAQAVSLTGQIAGAQMAANEAARRQKLGLPPVEPTLPTPKQIKQEKRDNLIFYLWLLLSIVIFCAPPAAFILFVIKLAFAAQGEKFP